MMIAPLEVTCDTCKIPTVADGIYYDLLLVHDRLTLVWDCPFCRAGHKVLKPGETTRALDAGARHGAEVRSRIARTHGPRL